MVPGLGAHTAHALDGECVCVRVYGVGVGIFCRTHVSLMGRSLACIELGYRRGSENNLVHYLWD